MHNATVKDHLIVRLSFIKYTFCQWASVYRAVDTNKTDEEVAVEDADEDENYEDAEEDEIEDEGGAIGKQLMQNGLQSPDSGIHGDKSANELQLSA